MVKGVAHACLTVLVVPDGLPCNPSLLALVPKNRLGIQALLSNGYSTLDRMRRLMSGQLTQATIDDLFSDERVLQIEGNAEIDFVTPYFAAAYTPITAKYFSVVRNEANPDVELSTVEEKNFILQTGYKFGDWIYLGVTGKQYSRKYIKSRFHLIDLATEAGKDAIKPRNQNGITLSPAATVFFPGSLKPRVAIMVANLGFVKGDREYLEDPIDFQGGVGITVPLGWAEMDFGIDYRSLSYDEVFGERFHFGTVFRFGAMSLFSGADHHGLSGGVSYGLEQINAGILFSTTQTPWSSSDYYANTVYLQVGWQI